MWSFMGISQDLKPLVKNIDNQKYFCFTIKQSRFVAKRMEISLFQDSIIDVMKLRSFRWELLTQKKDTIILKLETKVENLSLVHQNDEEQFKELNFTIKKQSKKIKRGKLERWLFGGGLLILTGIIIAK